MDNTGSTTRGRCSTHEHGHKMHAQTSECSGWRSQADEREDIAREAAWQAQSIGERLADTLHPAHAMGVQTSVDMSDGRTILASADPSRGLYVALHEVNGDVSEYRPTTRAEAAALVDGWVSR